MCFTAIYSRSSAGILNSFVILVILLTRSFTSTDVDAVLSLGVPKPLGPREVGSSILGGSVSIWMVT